METALTIQTPQAPTKRQLFALFCIYKRDFRNDNLTPEQVQELFKNAPGKRPTATKKDSLWEFMTNDKQLNRMVAKLRQTFGIVSVVKNDTNFVKDDGKRYVFFGGGCGFSFIEIDRRNKRGQAVLAQWQQMEQKYKTLVANTAMTKEQQHKIQMLGSPIDAVLMQDLGFNTLLNNIVAEYLESVGVTVKQVTSNLD